MKSEIIKKHNEIVARGERKKPKYEILHYADGSRYEGHLVNGVRQGMGTYYFANGGRYVGDWLNDKRHGKGTDYYTNGDRYKGDFYNDKREGYGTYYWSNGSSRSNQWKNDEEITSTVRPTTSRDSGTENQNGNNNAGCDTLVLCAIMIFGALCGLINIFSKGSLF